MNAYMYIFFFALTFLTQTINGQAQNISGPDEVLFRVDHDAGDIDMIKVSAPSAPIPLFRNFEDVDNPASARFPNFVFHGGFIIAAVNATDPNFDTRRQSVYISDVGNFKFSSQACQSSVNTLKTFVAGLDENFIVAVISKHSDISRWQLCTANQRLELLTILWHFGSGKIGRLVRNRRANTISEETFTAMTAARTLTLVGRYCNSWHTNSAYDSYCDESAGSCTPPVAPFAPTHTTFCSPDTFEISFLIAVLVTLALWGYYVWFYLYKLGHPNFMLPMDIARTVMLESFRRIQNERDHELDLEALLGDASPKKAEIVHSYVNPLTQVLQEFKLDDSDELLVSYWHYVDEALGNTEAGPFTSPDMRVRFEEGNTFQVEAETGIREAWWPKGVYYPMKDVFPNGKDTYFTESPVLPRPVLDYMKNLRAREDKRRETEKMRNHAEGGSPMSKSSRASRSPKERKGKKKEKK